jgi:hypothetical protein
MCERGLSFLCLRSAPHHVTEKKRRVPTPLRNRPALLLLPPPAPPFRRVYFDIITRRRVDFIQMYGDTFQQP